MPDPRVPAEDEPAIVERRALSVLVVAISLAFGWVLLPFYGTILWAAIIALLFAPVYRWLLPRMNGRQTRAALVTVLLAIVIVVIPFALVTASLAREASLLYQRIESGAWDPARYLRTAFDALPEWLGGLLDRFGLTDFESLQRRLVATLSQASKLIAAQAVNIGLKTFDFVAQLFITMYLAFFFVRDGDRIARSIREGLPLAADHKRELARKFATVIRATVKGNLLVAAIQGALGGVAFWFLDVNAPLLWAVLMAFLSLVPAVGAGLVWAPVALYLFASGAVWQGVALAFYGVLVIGLVDNLLRPILVGRDTRMPDYLVMISTLGGIAVFGLNGFVLGPAVAAMFIAVWHIHMLARPLR